MLGETNTETLSKMMGTAGAEYTDAGVALQDVTKRLIAMGRTWQPGDDYYSTDSVPCSLGAVSGTRQFTARVGWYGAPLPLVRSAPWRQSGGDVTAYWEDVSDVRYAFPCKVRGSHPRQETEVPFSVRFVERGLDHLDESFRGMLAATLARTMSTQLGCTNVPAIPKHLRLTHAAPSHPAPTPTNSPRYSTLSTHSPGHAPAPR